jgi:CSLREA domain-containing protein
MVTVVRHFALGSATVSLLLVALVLPIVASTYVVNSTADAPDADVGDGVCAAANGACTLRAAVMQANFTAGADNIILPAGTYTLTRAGDDDAAVLGDLDITDDLAIQGAGSSLTIVDGNGAVTGDRVFQILSSAKETSLSGLTIRNGKKITNTFDSGGGLYWTGGGGHLRLSHLIVEGNAAHYCGGIYLDYGSDGGDVTLDNLVLRANSATAAGGGLCATLNGPFALRNSQVYSNTAFQGGGISLQNSLQPFATTYPATIAGSQIYSNTASRGAGIDNESGNADNPLLLIESYLHHNSAFLGGAIENFGGLSILRSTLDANIAATQGGGIYNNDTAVLEITQSTLSANTAQFGGGIYQDAVFSANRALMKLVNSTVSGNSVALGSATPAPSPSPSAAGGGIYAHGGTVVLANTTVAGNQVSLPNDQHYIGGGGGLFIDAIASVTAGNSLIGNNVLVGGLTLPSPSDCYGLLHSTGYNLIESTDNTTIDGETAGNITGHDPVLGPLQNNGGPTFTRALLPGSPAINAANQNAPARDQRNYLRPDLVDIGAFEFGGTIPSSLGNISTRGFVGTGNNVLIAGLIVAGGGSKEVILRALGPTLGQPPFNVPGVLANPILELHDSTGTIITTNDNWGSAANAAAISASGYAPPNSHESAILTSLTPGNYTAIVKGANNSTGVALVEGYDLDGSTTASTFGNISTRGFVGTGNNVMIAGLIVKGPDSQNAIIRGLGPTLSKFGVPSVLADPTLELRDVNGNLLSSNDNWKDTQQTEIESTGLAPPNDKESAISATLSPANYTAILRGKNNTTGNGLVEVYALN